MKASRSALSLFVPLLGSNRITSRNNVSSDLDFTAIEAAKQQAACHGDGKEIILPAGLPNSILGKLLQVIRSAQFRRGVATPHGGGSP